MKVIIINGSPRVNGATGQILSKIAETIMKMDSNASIDYFDLAKLNLNYCLGCASCYRNGTCPLNDDLKKLSNAIETCDGLILGSPTYASNVSGQFKTLIDRGHFVFEQLLKNKACFSVITYENYGGKKAIAIVNDLITKSGGAVSGKYLVKLNHGDKVINAHRSKQIDNLCRKFLVKVNQKYPLSLFESLMRFIVFNVGIKPHVYKNELRYKGIINRWDERNYIS